MTDNLKTWERPHFVDDGGEPFLFYVVYGNIDFSGPLSRSSYRTNGCPEGIDLMAYGPQEHPEVPGSFRSGYVWENFVAENPIHSAEVARCKHCLVLRGTPVHAMTLNYLRDIVGLITYTLDNGGIAVYDPFLLRWWQPTEWKQHIFDPNAPVPHKHTVILVSQEEDSPLQWIHTRGMRKFGKPDISVHNVSEEYFDRTVELCNRLIEHQAYGHVVPDGRKIKMAGLPAGTVIHHTGDLDDPDFNNVHLEISWTDKA